METYDFDLENLISQMTNEEKAQLCSGRDFWHTQNIDRLNIPSLMMCDGPNGLFLFMCMKKPAQKSASSLGKSSRTAAFTVKITGLLYRNTAMSAKKKTFG